jgi:hypothetical protein
VELQPVVDLNGGGFFPAAIRSAIGILKITFALH